MKENMFTSTLVLTIICLIAAGLLGFSYTITKDKIEMRNSQELNDKLKEVFPAADNFKEEEGHYVILKDKEVIGFAAIGEYSGYSSTIKVLVGMDMNKSITGIRIIEQAETPGLGTGIAKPEFYEKFNGLSSEEVKLKKDNGNIDGITGATISSRAVTNAVRSTLQDTLEKLVDEQND